MKITTDTNILVSGTFWRGDSARILKMIDNGEIELILSEELIEEYKDVINRDEIIGKIKNKNLILNKAIVKILKDATIVEPRKKLNIVIEDPDDNMVLECAIEGKSDYIITNDNHLLKLKEYQGIKILTPEEFLRILRE